MPPTPPADEPDADLPEEVGAESPQAADAGGSSATGAPESAAKLGHVLGGLYGKLSGDADAGRRLGEKAGESLRGIVSEVVAEAEKRGAGSQADPTHGGKGSGGEGGAGEAMRRAAVEGRRLAQERRKAQLDETRQEAGAPKPDPEKPPAGVPTSMDGVNAAEALEATLKRARTGLERAVEEIAARGSDIASQVAEVRAQRRHIASGEDVWTRATSADAKGEQGAGGTGVPTPEAAASETEDASLVAAEVLTVLLRERGYASLSHALANASEGAAEAKRVVAQLSALGLLRRPSHIPEWEGHELVKVSEKLATCRVCEQTMPRDATSHCPKHPIG